MTISYVGGRTQIFAGANSGTTSVALTGLTGGIGSAPIAGDLVVVPYGFGSTTFSRVLTAPTGWTAIPRTSANSTYDANLTGFYKIMGSTPDTTIAVPNTGSTADAGAVTVHVFRGTAATNVITITNGLNGINSARPSFASVQPTVPSSVVLFIGVGATATGAVYTQTGLSGFQTSTSPDTNDVIIGSGYQVWSGSGPVTQTAFTGGTAVTGNSWASASLVINNDAVIVNLGGSASCITTASGDLSAISQVELSGTASVQTSATGNLSASSPITVLGAPTLFFFA